MACSTGEACGLTETRSSARRSPNHSAVIRLTIDALEAWWPPTLTPERFSRTRLAWWTIAAESHSTRRSIALSVSRSGAAGGGDGVVVVGAPLKACDLPMPEPEEDHEGHRPWDPARAPTRDPRPGPDHVVPVGLDGGDLDLARVPNRQPLPHVGAELVVPPVCVLLGPVGPGDGDGVLRVERERALHVAGVPPLGQLPDYVDVLGHGGKMDRAPVVEARPRACPPIFGSGQAGPRRTSGIA